MNYFYFFVFIIQYLYLCIFWWDTTFLPHYHFTYELNGEPKKAVIYTKPAVKSGVQLGNDSKRKVILFLSGSYNLEFHPYISKTIKDLGHRAPSYEMFVYEKTDESSIVIYDEVALFIWDLHNTHPIDELVLMGFSAGGVVASHIMNRMKDLPFKKKIITYDTPWQVQDNVESFCQNKYYRPDIVFFWKVHSTYCNHYNYNDIKQHIVSHSYFDGARELVEIIKNVHRFTYEEMYFVTGFNIDQTVDTIVYNIYNTMDPFIDRDTHNRYFDKCAVKIKFNNVFVEKNIIGHTSDMWNSVQYIDNIMDALRL